MVETLIMNIKDYAESSRTYRPLIFRFGNEHFGAIMGYEDYMISDSVISRVYYVEGLGHNLFSVGSRGSNLYTISVEDMMKSSPICLLSNAPRTNHGYGICRHLVERQNRTLMEAARTMLIFSKTLMFLWVAAIASTFFGALSYPTNDSEDLGKLKAIADIRIFVGYAPNRKGYRINNKRTRRIMKTIHVQFDELTEHMAPVHLSTRPEPNLLTPGQISLGLLPNLVPVAPYVPPTNKDLEILFQPIIDQDAPSTSHSPSSSKVQAPISHQGVAARPTIEDNPFAQAEDDPFVNVFAPEPSSKESSSGDVSTAESN
ncbi:hypothetical protein Tco_1317433 [Tanacetum coccineum]